MCHYNKSDEYNEHHATARKLPGNIRIIVFDITIVLYIAERYEFIFKITFSESLDCRNGNKRSEVKYSRCIHEITLFLVVALVSYDEITIVLVAGLRNVSKIYRFSTRA